MGQTELTSQDSYDSHRIRVVGERKGRKMIRGRNKWGFIRKEGSRRPKNEEGRKRNHFLVG